jgi:hypothetical protein
MSFFSVSFPPWANPNVIRFGCKYLYVPACHLRRGLKPHGWAINKNPVKTGCAAKKSIRPFSSIHGGLCVWVFSRGVSAKARGWAKVVRNMDVYFANDPRIGGGGFAIVI